MSDIYVHIGLPKTATTTLQSHLYPKLPNDKVDYLGVHQPRGEKKEALFEQFIQAVNRGGIKDIKIKISEKLKDKKVLVISEELITVSEPHINWREKLKNLSKILTGFDYKIIVSVREPVSAMYSFYIEPHSFFEKTNKSFNDLAINHPYMEIYHYKKLFNHLYSCFDVDKIEVIKFEDITKGNAGSIFKLMHPDNSKKFNVGNIKHENMRGSNRDYIFTGKNITFMDMIRKIFKVTGAHENILLNKIKGDVSPIISFLDNISVREINVKKPFVKDIEILKSQLRCETISLKEKYGIDYL